MCLAQKMDVSCTYAHRNLLVTKFLTMKRIDLFDYGIRVEKYAVFFSLVAPGAHIHHFVSFSIRDTSFESIEMCAVCALATTIEVAL